MESYEIDAIVHERALGLDQEERDVETLNWTTKRQSSFVTEVAEVPQDWNIQALHRRGHNVIRCAFRGKWYIERKARDWNKWADENCPEHLR